jgi:ATP-dependent helicase/nuclease subunit A
MNDSRAIDRESRRIIREELQTNLLVEAGAGSGKTQMLAERMAAGVASGDYQIQQMAAVTFTRKAASELRGRFHLALEASISPGSRGFRPQPEEQARVRGALSNLERFFAGTIHSFCARLLRERPVESGVSPGFTELDEPQDEELRNRAWRDFIAGLRSAGDGQMLELLETGVRPKDLESAFATICLNEDVEFPPGDGLCPDPKAAWTTLDKFWSALENLLPASLDDDTTCSIQKAARQYRAQLRVARKKLDRASTIADLLDTWDCPSKITQNRWARTAAEKKRFKQLIEPLHARFHAQTVAPFLTAWRRYVYRLSVTLLMRARDYARRERHRRNSLNYGDLLYLTAKVLRENTLVRRALQQKYRHLFVDEFQDTDPIQAEIVFLLAARENARAVCDWRTVPLRRDALFVVGDPKQSIYRFRRADIEIYNTVRGRFSDVTLGRVVSLTMNFRSVPALCRWANTVFAGQFPAAPTVHSPQFAPLDAREDDGKERSKIPTGLFTITHTCGVKEVPAADATAIARYIRSEVDAGRRRFGDFLILTRKKKDRIAPYASALEERNIPLEVSGAGAFGESAEVAALTVLLRALADPQDQLTLVNVLRGPLFGISDPELFAFRQSGRWFSIFHSGGFQPQPDGPATASESRGCRLQPEGQAVDSDSKDSLESDRVSTALNALYRYYRWTRMLPAGAALDKILEDTGYPALAATTPGGVEAGDLLHAVDRVRQVVEEGGSLADAADALEADSEASNEVESLPLEPGRTDVVRLMNLHKAKGLEADVVFLADPCGGFNPRVDVHIKRDGARALGWFKVGRKYTRQDGSPGFTLLGEHADWARHEQAEQPFLDQEQTRLLYVAATRAREMLVVSRQSPPKGTPAWGALNAALDRAKELPVPARVEVAAPAPSVCSLEAQAEAHGARLAADTRVNQPTWSIASVTAEAKHIAAMTRRAQPVAEGDPTRVVAQDTPSHRADAGLAWGTLIHGLLEHAMRHQNATRDDLRRLAMWLTVEEPQLRAVIEEALDTVERAVRADFWPVAQSRVHSVETPFTVAEPGRLTNGVIDLLFESDAGWQVVDYKTDRMLADGQYEAQLQAYRRALQQLGCGVAGASIVKVRSEPA